jgi:hypothetical protein
MNPPFIPKKQRGELLEEIRSWVASRTKAFTYYEAIKELPGVRRESIHGVLGRMSDMGEIQKVGRCTWKRPDMPDPVHVPEVMVNATPTADALEAIKLELGISVSKTPHDLPIDGVPH